MCSPAPRRYDEVRKPALVLVPELPRAIDAAHAKHDGAKAIDARVVAHVLICRSLRASIRRVKVERAGFGDPIWQVAILVARILLYQRDVLHAAVHLVCGCEHHHRLTRALPRSLQHVQGAQRVDFEVQPGILDRRGDGNLSSQMIDRVHILGCRLDRLGIADVTLDESQVTIGMLPLKPLSIALAAPTGQRIKDRDFPVVAQQIVHQMATDEPRSSRHKDRHNQILLLENSRNSDLRCGPHLTVIDWFISLTTTERPGHVIHRLGGDGAATTSHLRPHGDRSWKADDVARESGEPSQAPMNSPQTGLRPIEWYSKPCRRMRAG